MTCLLQAGPLGIGPQGTGLEKARRGQLRFASGPPPQKSGLPKRSMRWPKPWASAISSRLCGTLLYLQRSAHLEVEAAADQHERDVVQRVRVALAQLVGPDDQRVVEQAAGAARLGRLGQPLGQVGQLLAEPLVDLGQLFLGLLVRCPARATARGAPRRRPASASSRRRPSWCIAASPRGRSRRRSC